MQTLHAASPDDWRTAIAAHPRLLVDYHKDDCPAPRMLHLPLQRFAGEPASAGLVVLKARLETLGEDFFRGLGLRQTPTLSLVGDGVERCRLPGFQPPARIAAAVLRWLPPGPASVVRGTGTGRPQG